MLISNPAVALPALSPSVFSQLRLLLEQMGQELEAAIVLTSEMLEAKKAPQEHWFTLVASSAFSALVTGKPIGPIDSPPIDRPSLGVSSLGVDVNITFAPQAIVEFIERVSQPLSHRSVLYRKLQQLRSVPQGNDAALQTHFTQRLITTLTSEQYRDSLEQPSLPSSNFVPIHPAFSQPVVPALRQQIEQERLLNQVMSQIRHSLELPVILQTALEQVRLLLKVDRVVIYQFHDEHFRQPIQAKRFSLSPECEVMERSGFVAYESRALDTIPSVLDMSEACEFYQACSGYDKYHQGFVVAVTDVEEQYASIPCLLDFLRTAQVRAKLIAPITVQERLWGLLIAHRCFSPYRWQDGEQRFLQHIAEHLAIAINQAQLYAQVQQQKQTLEERVIERTQELQDALLAAQTANRSKSEFLAAVSHELRSPLTCVIGMSATLLRWSQNMDERQQRFLQTIHDSGEHLLELINDILELSQLEAGKAMLNLQEISLSSMAQQTLKIVEERALLAGVHLELDVQVDAVSDRLMADPQRVQHILLNLLSNAIKFTPNGGLVTLRVMATNGIATLQVKDTGIGIAEQQQEMLFQKFQQLDSSYHRQYAGLGLGLALTKQLVDLHGGWIEVDSVVGAGSVFTVHLPSMPQLATASDLTVPGIAPDQAMGRIVLIENHEESANIICDILNAAGYQLVWMLEGSAAINQIEILQPLAVLVSAHLPDSDGYEIVQGLRLNPSTRKVKVIGLIADDNQQRQRFLAAGADGYVTKPINPEQALITVTALLA